MLYNSRHFPLIPLRFKYFSESIPFLKADHVSQPCKPIGKMFYAHSFLLLRKEAKMIKSF
jgi:hypothetical protein